MATTPGTAVPGTSVPSGSAVGPGGAQGVQGLPGPIMVSSDAGNIATIGSDNQILVPQSQIWSVRLRSFSSIGNCNFEVTQRNCGTLLTAPGAGVFIEDRFQSANPNNLTGFTWQAVNVLTKLPGTNFYISNRLMRFTLTTQKTSLAATDVVGIQGNVEGPQLRELVGDVHSFSLLVQSSVAPVTFGLAIRNDGVTYCLNKLCTISAANTPTLITLPNLPLWASGGGWSTAPGVRGYFFTITLAAGTTSTAPANDVWAAGSWAGANGQGNFLANAVNSTFDIAFIQHEPGPVCSTLQDLPFGVNLDGPMGCQRYFQTTYPYGTKPGTVTNNGCLGLNATASAGIAGPITFRRTMAKVPTITGYSPATGAANNVRDVNSAVDRAISGLFTAPGDSGFAGWSLSTQNASATNYIYHYVLDTGW